MALHNPVCLHLEQNGIQFDSLPHTYTDSLQQAALLCQAPAEQVARAVLLGDERGVLLVLLPLNHVINFARLYALTQRRLEPVTRDAARYIFPGCAPGSIPPVAEPFGIGALIDESLLEAKTIYLEPGSHELLLRLSGTDFSRLHRSARHGRFSNPVGSLKAGSGEFTSQPGYVERHAVDQLRPIEGMQARTRQLQHLPPMSHLANSLLDLHRSSDSTVRQLADLLKSDPGISAQLLRLARSPYFGEETENLGLKTAIEHRLGLTTALSIALSIALLRPFDSPREGPLGRHPVWRHAITSAELATALCALMPHPLELDPGITYLIGLLHNCGYTVLGHTLKPEFFLLNRVVDANPNVPVPLIEQRALSISHTQIGAWLMRAWRMPDVLEVALREHHNDAYRGPDAHYANLLLLTDSLLGHYGLGDTDNAGPPPHIPTQLGISLAEAQQTAQNLMARLDKLDRLAAILSA